MSLFKDVRLTLLCGHMSMNDNNVEDEQQRPDIHHRYVTLQSVTHTHKKIVQENRAMPLEIIVDRVCRQLFVSFDTRDVCCYTYNCILLYLKSPIKAWQGAIQHEGKTVDYRLEIVKVIIIIIIYFQNT